MTSEELAKEVGLIHAEALSRILVEGKASYGSEEGSISVFGSDEPVVIAEKDDFQRFEVESFEQHLSELEAELLDAINWAAMAVLKLRERRAHVAEAYRHLARGGDSS